MARSITIKAIDRRADRTYIRVGKEEIEVPGNLADLKAWIRQQFDEKDLLAIALAVYLARDPDMSNPSLIVGRTITLDLAGRVNHADAVVRVS